MDSGFPNKLTPPPIADAGTYNGVLLRFQGLARLDATYRIGYISFYVSLYTRRDVLQLQDLSIRTPTSKPANDIRSTYETPKWSRNGQIPDRLGSSPSSFSKPNSYCYYDPYIQTDFSLDPRLIQCGLLVYISI